MHADGRHDLAGQAFRFSYPCRPIYTPSKWTRPFWGTLCRRSPKSLSLAPKASICIAGIERIQKCMQAYHYVRRRRRTYSLLFRDFRGVPRWLAVVSDPNPLCPVARCRKPNGRNKCTTPSVSDIQLTELSTCREDTRLGGGMSRQCASLCTVWESRVIQSMQWSPKKSTSMVKENAPVSCHTYI